MKTKKVFICIISICITFIIATWFYTSFPEIYDFFNSGPRPIGLAIIFCVTYALIEGILSNNYK